jgi:Co/Zn/Cd efflux system component
MNVKGAFLHVAGGALSSLGVVAADLVRILGQ